MEKYISRGSLRDIYDIARRTSSPERVYRVMKEVTRSTHKGLMKGNANATMQKLRHKHLCTGPVNDLCTKLCNDLPQKTDKIKQISQQIMTWRCNDTKYHFKKASTENATEWKSKKRTLQRHNIIRPFKQVWQTEKNRIEKALRRKRDSKITHLTNKQRSKHSPVNIIEGIIVKDQPLDKHYEANPRIYDNTKITDSEHRLLENLRNGGRDRSRDRLLQTTKIQNVRQTKRR